MKTHIFKTFAKTIVTGFLCATVICGSVLGDVFEAKFANGTPVVIENPDVFFYFVKAYHDMNGLQNDFTDDQVQWQMLGFAVFFPKGSSELQQVYVAMKRKYQDGQFLADNNPKTGGHVLNYSSNMHTERQLAIVALEKAVGCNLITASNSITMTASNPTTKNYDPERLGELRDGAQKPIILSNQVRTPINYNIEGTLCVYTNGHPCMYQSRDNYQYACMEYYAALLQKFPNIKIHVYFDGSKNVQLDSHCFVKYFDQIASIWKNIFDSTDITSEEMIKERLVLIQHMIKQSIINNMNAKANSVPQVQKSLQLLANLANITNTDDFCISIDQYLQLPECPKYISAVLLATIQNILMSTERSVDTEKVRKLLPTILQITISNISHKLSIDKANDRINITAI